MSLFYFINHDAFPLRHPLNITNHAVSIFRKLHILILFPTKEGKGVNRAQDTYLILLSQFIRSVEFGPFTSNAYSSCPITQGVAIKNAHELLNLRALKIYFKFV